MWDRARLEPVCPTECEGPARCARLMCKGRAGLTHTCESFCKGTVLRAWGGGGSQGASPACRGVSTGAQPNGGSKGPLVAP